VRAVPSATVKQAMMGVPLSVRRFVLGMALAGVVIGVTAPSATSAQEASLNARYASAIGGLAPWTPAVWRADFADHVLLIGSYYGVDPRLLTALVAAESGWNYAAVSPAGARGLGQLMPGTAAGLDVNPDVPTENLDGTARHLRRLLDKYDSHGDRQGLSLAIAAYNAGAGAVDKYHNIPPYAETQAYVPRVLGLYDRLAMTLPLPTPGQMVAERSARMTAAVAPPKKKAANAPRVAEPFVMTVSPDGSFTKSNGP
jgi:soluble lytic murein transglycosylase-like protein